MLGLLVFFTSLWIALDVVTAAMIASGFVGLVVLGGLASDVVGMVLVLTAVLGALAVIAALVGTVLSIFGN
jgi:hypothetical protein